MNIVIQTDKLSKHYGKGGEIRAVDMLDLEVYENETFGLLGLSFRRLFPELNRIVGLLYDHMLQTAIILLLEVVLLYLGKGKLNSIE